MFRHGLLLVIIAIGGFFDSGCGSIRDFARDEAASILKAAKDEALVVLKQAGGELVEAGKAKLGEQAAKLQADAQAALMAKADAAKAQYDRTQDPVDWAKWQALLVAAGGVGGLGGLLHVASTSKKHAEAIGDLADKLPTPTPTPPA